MFPCDHNSSYNDAPIKYIHILIAINYPKHVDKMCLLPSYIFLDLPRFSSIFILIYGTKYPKRIPFCGRLFAILYKAFFWFFITFCRDLFLSFTYRLEREKCANWKRCKRLKNDKDVEQILHVCGASACFCFFPIPTFFDNHFHFIGFIEYFPIYFAAFFLLSLTEIHHWYSAERRNFFYNKNNIKYLF